MTETSRLSTARGIYLAREGAPTAGDRWFSLYLIAFVTAFYVTPVAYLIGDFLDPGIAERLTSAESSAGTTGVITLLGLLVLLSGRWIQGPVFLTPFLAHALLATDIDRRRVLARPTLTTILSIAVVFTLLSAVGIFVLTLAGAWPWQHYGWLIAAAFLLGMHLGLLSFLGQRLSTRALTGITLVMILLALSSFVTVGGTHVTPFCWTAMIWTGETSWWALIALTTTGLAGVILLLTHYSALGKMPAERILAQSRRLSEARLFTSTGNINDAVDLFRAKPRRRLQRRTLGSGLRQDAVTALRAPVSLAAAAALIPAGAALVALSAPAIGQDFEASRLVITVPLALVGGLLLFVGTGSLTVGWREVKNEFDAAALFGWSARRAIGRRMLWPLICTAILAAAGGVAVVILSELGWPILGWTLGIAGLALSARFFQSMRDRDIPVEFLAPTVIPGGIDLSAVKILVWLGDGIILTVTGVLAVVVLPWEAQTLAVTLGALSLTGLAWGWARTGANLLTQEPKKSAVGSPGA